jgi:hypothetical protein
MHRQKRTQIALQACRHVRRSYWNPSQHSAPRRQLRATPRRLQMNVVEPDGRPKKIALIADGLISFQPTVDPKRPFTVKATFSTRRTLELSTLGVRHYYLVGPIPSHSHSLTPVPPLHERAHARTRSNPEQLDLI